MNTVLFIVETAIVLLGFGKFTSSRICQTSKCVVNTNPEFDCRSTYLAAHIQCGSSDTVCIKTLVFNTSRTSVESSQWILVTRRPLVSVLRTCGSNPSNLPMSCFQASQSSPRYDVHICLCDSDYCNGASLIQGSELLRLIAMILAIIYSHEILN